jgi:hypothetical protein
MLPQPFRTEDGAVPQKCPGLIWLRKSNPDPPEQIATKAPRHKAKPLVNIHLCVFVSWWRKYFATKCTKITTKVLKKTERIWTIFRFSDICIWRSCIYGDLQPRFGVPGGELDTADVRDYFKLLLDHNLLNPDDKPVLSVEVRPLLAEESSELIIANAKRVIKEAWASL